MRVKEKGLTMQTMDQHKSFAESMGHLLKRFCPEDLLKVLSEELEQLKAIEAELTEKAKAKEADLHGEISVIETGHLENIITECSRGLAKRPFLELLLDLGALCLKYGEFTAAKSVYKRIIDTAGTDAKSSTLSGKAYAKRAEIRLRQAHWTAAVNDLKKAAALFKKAKDAEGLAMVENSFGVYATEQGDMKKAATHFKKAQAGFEKAGNSERANTALMNLGILASIAGRWEEGLAYYQRILPQFEKLGQVSRLVEVHHNIGMLFLAKGDAKAAISQFDESLNHASLLHYRAFIGMGFLGKAAAYARLTDFPLAMVFVQRALGIFRQLSDHLSIADAYKVKGIIHRELDRPQLAELYFRTSLRLNEEYNNPLNLGETYLELGRLYARTKEPAKAAQALKKAATYFKRVGAVHEAKTAQSLMANA